ncbi:hypothetical protein C0Q70_06324 [Pomacea canaliculata]|uniref:Uncharacterized protein n=1 Tax=Pomacea canaliculata TaxID=400727 RepID=A0A2T7PNP6_POMCA|nr:hypothetical protein C0Q70_06324 [Pomacea canaliculata]
MIQEFGQSVAQQCLLEQLRNVNNNNINQQQPTTAQEATLNAFHSICQNFQQYIQCFRDRLPNSNDPPDAFLSLLFDPLAMDVAYRGLCQDINGKPASDTPPTHSMHI